MFNFKIYKIYYYYQYKLNTPDVHIFNFFLNSC